MPGFLRRASVSVRQFSVARSVQFCAVGHALVGVDEHDVAAGIAEA
jgi:hypothetical protein